MAKAINKIVEQAGTSELLTLRTEVLALRQELVEMAKTWDDLKAEVTESRTVQQSVLKLLGEIKTQLNGALQASDPSKNIEEVIAMIDENDREMAAAVAATPENPNPPVEPTPPSPPTEPTP